MMKNNLSYSTAVLRRFYCISLWMLVFSLAGGMGPGHAETPIGAVSGLLEKIRNIQNGPDLSAEQIQANGKISTAALGHLDVSRVSQKALGRHWQTLDKKQQEGFVRLLSDLFRHVAFPNSAKFFGEMKIDTGPEQIKADLATVPLTVHHAKEGKVGLDFVLWQNGNRWRVTDVVLDGVSMANNLRSKFYKILKKKGYAELVRRMEKKLRQSATGGK